MIDEREDCYNYVPGPDRPISERVDYVRQRTISELEIFADDLGLDDVRALPQNTFTAGLRFCCRMIFRPQTQDKNADYFKLDLADRELICALSQMFIDLCDRYNKICQVGGLSAFLGVSNDYLYSLSKYDNTRYINSSADNNIILDSKNDNIYYNSCGGSESGNVSNNLFKPINLIKGLKEAKERQLQGLLIDGKGNLIGVMSILNHEFGYRSEGVDDVTPTLTTAERQKSLADKYRVSALPDKLSDT
jgi:hypothetical protein